MPTFWDAEYAKLPLSNLERFDGDVLFDWVSTTLPILGQRVDWERASGRLKTSSSFEDLSLLSDEVESELRDRVKPGNAIEHAGDNLSPVGVRIDISNVDDKFGLLVKSLLEIPEHHYFADVERSWLMVVTFEYDLDCIDF